MPIIDAHTHFGPCRVFDIVSTEEDLFGGMNDVDIDVSIVQPYPGADSAKAVHDSIADLAKKHPGRFLGLASLNPHLSDTQTYFDEISRCVKELGFVGVKLHAIGHALNPAGTDGTTVFDTANQLGIPVMMHTGPGIPFAAPSAVTPNLRKFPNVQVILAHAGHGIFSGEAIAVAEAFPQVTLEPSWCQFYMMGAMVQSLGASRVMYGSDLPANARIMLDSFKALGLSKEDMDMVMGGTATRVFKLNV